MAWIETVEESDAKGELSEIYDAIRDGRGKVSNIMKAQSLRPEAMRAHLELYMALMFSRSGLSRAERELIAAHVSVLNGCGYCKSHHGAALNTYWKDAARVESFMNGIEDPGLSDRERSILAYSGKLTREPGAAAVGDVVELRAAGFSDADILDMTMIVGYFNFVNRIALGMGVEFSPEEVEGYKV